MTKGFEKLDRLIKEAVNDEKKAIRFYDKILDEIDIIARIYRDAGDAIYARNMIEFGEKIWRIQQDEKSHYNYLKRLKL